MTQRSDVPKDKEKTPTVILKDKTSYKPLKMVDFASQANIKL